MENINLQLIVLIVQLVNGLNIADNCLILQTIYNCTKLSWQTNMQFCILYLYTYSNSFSASFRAWDVVVCIRWYTLYYLIIYTNFSKTTNENPFIFSLVWKVDEFYACLSEHRTQTPNIYGKYCYVYIQKQHQGTH